MVAIRPVQAADLPAISALDARLTGSEKPAYWQEMLAPEPAFPGGRDREGRAGGLHRRRDPRLGIRPAAGRLGVRHPDRSQAAPEGRRQPLFDALVARFKAKGVTRVRTLVDRKDHLILSFFRAQGMVAGPSLQLDKDLL